MGRGIHDILQEWKENDMNYYAERREKIAAVMSDRSALILYSGAAPHFSEDEYFPFEVNHHFHWMTGMDRPKQALMIRKNGEKVTEILFIEEPDPGMERWIGKMPTKEQAAQTSGISDVRLIGDMDAAIGQAMDRFGVERLYMDVYRYDITDLADYNLAQALRLQQLYPAVLLSPLRPLIAPLRAEKDEEELRLMRRAGEITGQSLEEVMRHLRPGMKEYQVQAVFEGSCRYLGAEAQAFPTIAAGGKNACSMHYEENRDTLEEGSLILLDLGAKYHHYCSDISRTYPVSGTFTPRQREIYDLVLAANRAVAEAAAPGMQIRKLGEIADKVLADGLIALGMIGKPEELRKYLPHGVSHPLGMDTHDIMPADGILQPGWVITDEPGLYIDEEGFGIRIEDDLLITEDGCEVLSAGIIKEAEEIEEFMKKARLCSGEEA